MKTKKQVMEQLFKLQKKLSERKDMIIALTTYADKRGCAWTVKLRLTSFRDEEVEWSDELIWEHYSVHNEERERDNEKRFSEFCSRVVK